jgi:hypothetical protein
LPTQERYGAYESLARRRRGRGGVRLVVRKIGEEIDFSEQGQYEGGSWKRKRVKPCSML